MSLFGHIQSGSINLIVPNEYLAKCYLHKVYVGQATRDSFNLVESTHSIMGICSLFGLFVKFIVELYEEEDLTCTTLSKHPRGHDLIKKKCLTHVERHSMT